MLEVRGTDKSFSINFPTSLSELTPEVLGALTENIGLPPNYCVIALCFEPRLLDLATEIRAQKAGNATVNILNAKISPEDSERVKSKVGQKIIADRTDVERGSHVNVPTLIANKNVIAYMGNDQHLLTTIIKGNPDGAPTDDKVRDNMVKNKNNTVVIVEFKIIPINDIKGSIDIDTSIIDPFKLKHATKTSKLVN